MTLSCNVTEQAHLEQPVVGTNTEHLRVWHLESLTFIYECDKRCKTSWIHKLSES